MKLKKSKDQLQIKLSFWEKIWSFHGDIKIPHKDIVLIKMGAPESGWLDIKFPGSFLPGVIKAGTYITKRGKEFWYWTTFRKYVYTIELRNMKYKRLVLAFNTEQKL